jgi:hypothetical protein
MGYVAEDLGRFRQFPFAKARELTRADQRQTWLNELADRGDLRCRPTVLDEQPTLGEEETDSIEGRHLAYLEGHSTKELTGEAIKLGLDGTSVGGVHMFLAANGALCSPKLDTGAWSFRASEVQSPTSRRLRIKHLVQLRPVTQVALRDGVDLFENHTAKAPSGRVRENGEHVTHCRTAGFGNGGKEEPPLDMDWICTG